jgi:hypothetical protein
MDHGDFDALTRSVASGTEPRRAVVRLLLGGALGVLTTRLGLADMAAGKAKKPKAKTNQGLAQRKRTGHGQLQAERNRKGKGKGKKHRRNPPPPPPPLPPGCQHCSECQMCQGGACVPDPALAGVRCLGSGAACGYCQGGQCAGSATPPCPDGTCPSRGQCCPGEQRCPDPESPTGFACLGRDDCCPDQKRCGDRCIFKSVCCEADRPQCGACQEAVCKPSGAWICWGKACGGGVCVGEDECCPDEPTPVCGECEELACEKGAWRCAFANGATCSGGGGAHYQGTCCAHIAPGGLFCCPDQHFCCWTRGCCPESWRCTAPNGATGCINPLNGSCDAC